MEEGHADEYLVWSCLESVKISIWCQSWRPEVPVYTLKTESEQVSLSSKHLE